MTIARPIQSAILGEAIGRDAAPVVGYGMEIVQIQGIRRLVIVSQRDFRHVRRAHVAGRFQAAIEQVGERVGRQVVRGQGQAIRQADLPAIVTTVISIDIVQHMRRFPTCPLPTRQSTTPDPYCHSPIAHFYLPICWSVN